MADLCELTKADMLLELIKCYKETHPIDEHEILRKLKKKRETFEALLESAEKKPAEHPKRGRPKKTETDEETQLANTAA